MPNKRLNIRRELGVEINCLVNCGQNAVTGITHNISNGGLCLITKELLVSGITVDLEFNIPFKEKINAVAEVKWSKKKQENRYFNGLDFYRIKENDLELIKKYIKEQKPEKPVALESREKRRSQRFRLGVLVNYFSIEAYAKDISESGLRITAREILKKDDEIKLMFFLYNLDNIMLLGKIVWCKHVATNQYEYGIIFTDSNEKNVKAIRNFIENEY